MWVAGEMKGKYSKSDRYAGMTERQIEWGKKQSVMPAERWQEIQRDARMTGS